MSQITTTQIHVYGFVTSNICCVLVGANCRILKTPSYANEMEQLNMDTKIEIILLYEVGGSARIQIGR
jgi:hypothetical protein